MLAMKTYDYAFRFTKEGEGWVITCRDIPEAISQSEANEDRIEIAEGCLQAALESRIHDNEALPIAIQSALREPNAIASTDLNYQKKCLLLKGLYGDTLSDWLYPALSSLGALRNKCAHVLDHPKLDEAISSFIRAAYERSEENETLLFKTRGKGYSLPLDAPKNKKQSIEAIAQQQHDLSFRLPMACERVIELLLRKWDGLQKEALQRTSFLPPPELRC